MRKVYLCQGCIDQYKEEYGDSLGYTEPVEVVVVSVNKCDNQVMADGRFRFEYRLDAINEGK